MRGVGIVCLLLAGCAHLQVLRSKPAVKQVVVVTRVERVYITKNAIPAKTNLTIPTKMPEPPKSPSSKALGNYIGILVNDLETMLATCHASQLPPTNEE